MSMLITLSESTENRLEIQLTMQRARTAISHLTGKR